MSRSAPEVVHVGSASRDITAEDPRGWRLGGGVTYAALTTARLGLRTAAIIGVDASAATATELGMLADAGVDVQLVELPEAGGLRRHVYAEGAVDLQVHEAGQEQGVRVLVHLLGVAQERVVRAHVGDSPALE